MYKKIIFLFFLLCCPHGVFPQEINSENRPQAYLLSRGDVRTAISRPRIVEPFVEEDLKAVYKSRRDYTLEREVFNLINIQRSKLGLNSLQWNEEVAGMARLHSENMANFNFFSHTDLGGLLVNERADAFGIRRWRAIGENIAYNRGYRDPASSAVERWMQSPSHRENLLNNRWKESGIGIAVTEEGVYYFTEVFLLRK